MTTKTKKAKARKVQPKLMWAVKDETGHYAEVVSSRAFARKLRQPGDRVVKVQVREI